MPLTRRDAARSPENVSPPNSQLPTPNPQPRNSLLLTFDNTRAIVVSTFDKRAMAPTRLDLLQGTLDLLILRTLFVGPMHGWAISQRIQQISQDVLQVNQGSLYPALHRLEEAGWIDAEWGRSPEHNRQAKFYRLTRSGERRLREETRQWEQMAAAVARVLTNEA